MKLRACMLAVVLGAAFLGAGCSMKQQADAKFGDQNFKTAIALIELYKVRYGHYPDALRDLRYAGGCDAIARNAGAYKRVDGGYELDVVRGWVGRPTLSYPADFWQGLGLVSSNVAGVPQRMAPPSSAR